MMRQQLIITLSLAAILSVALCLKFIYYPETSGNTAFYFHSTFWICGILITIIGLNMIWNAISAQKGVRGHRPHAFWPNRRKTFRIIYPAFLRPTLIVDDIDGIRKRQLEFAIVDLSQEGSCFLDDGSLGPMKTFSGRIRLNNGETITISGEYIRQTDDHVSVQFSRSISWPILLEEQRRVLTRMKPAPRHLS